jgi:hypothetical protein
MFGRSESIVYIAVALYSARAILHGKGEDLWEVDKESGTRKRGLHCTFVA